METIDPETTKPVQLAPNELAAVKAAIEEMRGRIISLEAMFSVAAAPAPTIVPESSGLHDRVSALESWASKIFLPSHTYQAFETPKPDADNGTAQTE